MSNYQTPTLPADAKIRNVALIVHALYAANIFIWVTSLVGVIIAYLKRDEAAGTIYESHLTYAIRTFWIGLGLTAVGALLSFVVVGIPILIFTLVWYIVRVVRAFLAWNDSLPIADPERFF